MRSRDTVFPDWQNPKTAAWWARQNDKFHDVIPYDGQWLDMNEPASFKYAPENGPVLLKENRDEESQRLDVPAYAVSTPRTADCLA